MTEYIILYLLIGTLWAWYVEWTNCKYFNYNDIEYYDRNNQLIPRELWESKYGPVENYYSPKWSLSFRIFVILIWPINVLYFLYILITNQTPPPNGTAI